MTNYARGWTRDWPVLARLLCRAIGHRPRPTILSWEQRIAGHDMVWSSRWGFGPVRCQRCLIVVEAVPSPLPTASCTDGTITGLPLIDNLVEIWA